MSMSQSMIEQNQEIHLADGYRFNSDITVDDGLLCAWCLSEQGLPAGEGSHDICTKHANGMVLQSRANQRSTITEGGKA